MLARTCSPHERGSNSAGVHLAAQRLDLEMVSDGLKVTHRIAPCRIELGLDGVGPPLVCPSPFTSGRAGVKILGVIKGA
jgi:hypothetical protein